MGVVCEFVFAYSLVDGDEMSKHKHHKTHVNAQPVPVLQQLSNLRDDVAVVQSSLATLRDKATRILQPLITFADQDRLGGHINDPAGVQWCIVEAMVSMLAAWNSLALVIADEAHRTYNIPEDPLSKSNLRLVNGQIVRLTAEHDRMATDSPQKATVENLIESLTVQRARLEALYGPVSDSDAGGIQ